MKISVCDDEKIQVDLLAQMIQDWAARRKITVEVNTFYSAESLWFAWQDGDHPDLLFLDIQMNDMNGMQLARKIRQQRDDTLICFITGVQDYVFEGYDVDAIGYILKPYKQEQIDRILDKAEILVPFQDEVILIPCDEETIRIHINDIVALEARAHDTIFWLKKSRTNERDFVESKNGFNQWLQHKPLSGFIKIHRSYAVNMRNIVAVRKDVCVDSEGKVWPISRNCRDMAIHAFIEASGGQR